MNDSKQFIECSEETIKDNLIEIPEIICDKSEFEINGNEIKVKEDEIFNLYFKYKEKKPFQKIMTKENETTYCPSFIKYFEITLNAIDKQSYVSIGVISSPDKLKKERMIGWDKGTIGLHSNGKVYNENYIGIKSTQLFKKMMLLVVELI